MNYFLKITFILMLIISFGCNEDEGSSSSDSNSSSSQNESSSGSVGSGNVTITCHFDLGVKSSYKGSQEAIDSLDCGDGATRSDSLDPTCGTNMACKGEGEGIEFCVCWGSTENSFYADSCISDNNTVASSCDL